jgi:hypothetical protein
LRRTARIREFLDFTADALAREASLLEGRRGRCPAVAPGAFASLSISVMLGFVALR